MSGSGLVELPNQALEPGQGLGLASKDEGIVPSVCHHLHRLGVIARFPKGVWSEFGEESHHGVDVGFFQGHHHDLFVIGDINFLDDFLHARDVLRMVRKNDHVWLFDGGDVAVLGNEGPENLDQIIGGYVFGLDDPRHDGFAVGALREI